ncbi:hypothetical protein FRC04_011476 [Tulasnella sp. 424]|nr:hypothetical protein FRC04_011476 [Tulasnella sp. 424]KAG8971687.1 hypothetical protein FRC05_010853 [Tulasnella sp. 425]
MQFTPAAHKRVLGTCVCLLLFLSFLFHDTGDVVLLSTSAYAKIQPIVAKALDAYHATLAVAQLGVDCVSSGLDWVVEFTTWLLESSGIIETLPIPNDIFIPKRARFDSWGKQPINLPVPSRTWAQRNRAGIPETGDSPTSTKPAPLLPPPTSRDVDTTPAPWKPRKADYWSTARFAQVSTPASKTGATVRARREAARLDTIAEDSSATIPGPNTPSTLIATSPFPTTPPATTITATKRSAGAATQDAVGEPRTPGDSGAALSTQVSGRARKTGLFGESRPEVAAAMASAGRSRPIAQANIDRIENASRRPGFKTSGRRRRELAVVTPLETIAEDDRVVTFSDELQVREVPIWIFDELARQEFVSEEMERHIEAAYWAWVEEEKKMLPRVKAMLRRIRVEINARRVATSGRWARVRAVFHRGTA